MEKQASDEYSSVLLDVFEERCRFDDLLIEPSILERELPKLDSETKVELYKHALLRSKEPQDIKSKLMFCIDILEEDQVIQCYMDAKAKETLKKDNDEEIIANIIKNIEAHKKAKRGLRGFIRAIRK